MHTADLRVDDFMVRIDGDEKSVEQLFPCWGKHQRFGILVQSPLGAIGASLLIQAAIAKFFEYIRETTDPEVWRGLPGPSVEGVYPEIFALHVGRRWGDFNVYDFWPPHREAVVEADPLRVLEAINDRGITVLAVPEGTQHESSFMYPEERTFLWRTEQVFEYSATGRVSDPDVTIQALTDTLESNVSTTLDPIATLTDLRLSYAEAFKATNGNVTTVDWNGRAYIGKELDDALRWATFAESRYPEVSMDERAAAGAFRELVVSDGCATESYRRREIGFALSRLVH